VVNVSHGYVLLSDTVTVLCAKAGITITWNIPNKLRE